MTNTSKPYDLTGKRVWVAGHRGMVGSAIVRRLESENVAEVLTATRSELDLKDKAAVDAWMDENKPDAIFLAAAKVGGIHANSVYPADFLYDNLAIASNIIHKAHAIGTEKLLFLGSSCIYPKFADQPIEESSLLSGALEPTNEWYAIAKIAGIKLCQAYRQQHGSDFISAMPTNLYGPGDNYHLENSHVIPALIRKAYNAREENADSMEIWGTGTARREFMHADDCADGLVFLMKNYSGHEHVNVSQGDDIPIEDLARLIMKLVGFKGTLTKDTTKPDGTPRKLMSNSRMAALGWSPTRELEDGLADAISWFETHLDTIREA
ncbi:GDP-L-fucose synthase [Litorimonas cladophorae]|uniref:GDP-L-fucose synthase n=1 Tax=Litorimonas cladophorae TaxID=1220491 RepID=A0A918KNM9_9PROT|nr:GDP-L-fucose synthase [Litorimonas cladophorae]GGX70544.1 GDP-L-fucose synthase [Litorimonas cladophorae]